MKLTWRQKLVLRAAQAVDFLPFRVHNQTDIPTGIYRSLVRLGYLRVHPSGWEATEEGRALNVWWSDRDREEQQMVERRRNLRAGKSRSLIRYGVVRGNDGWKVIDRENNNAYICTCRQRDQARDKARELNTPQPSRTVAGEMRHE